MNCHVLTVLICSSLESFVQGFKRDMERYYIVSFKVRLMAHTTGP